MAIFILPQLTCCLVQLFYSHNVDNPSAKDTKVHVFTGFYGNHRFSLGKKVAADQVKLKCNRNMHNCLFITVCNTFSKNNVYFASLLKEYIAFII